MFIVHQSNRTEVLIDALASVLAEPLPDPLQAEVIAVQSLGMRTWLSQQLAGRLGIWANGEFPFPRALIGRVAQEVLGAEIHAPGDDPYASESMTWAVLASLPAILDEPGCQELRRYLTGEVRELKTFQLARRIAGVFDQYCLYRRELVLGWEAGEGADWQALLFRAVRDRLGPDHQAGILERLLTRLGRTWSPGELPPRLSVFGISSLPPAYLQVLAGLGHHLDVHLYLLNPCAQYWADLTRADQIARRAEEADLTEAQAAEQLHLDEGHPLLASLGRQGQDMLRLLGRYAPDAQSVERFVDPLSAGADTALTRLQADILTLRDPNRDGPRPDLDSDDRSVSFHSCHAPTREVEVLHDQLRDLFESDPDLEPSDVLVMAPDIEAYAPLVEAVFGGGHDGGAPIPFGISDRRQRSEAQVISSFLLLLELVGGRLDIVQVFDLLAVEPVRARFGLGASEVELAEGWAREAGVRWGLDAAHREASGQPGLEENTWRFGLDRMLLGYAMPADERGLFAGRLAFDEIEGLEAATLGKLASFLQALDRAHRELGKPRRLGRWRDDLVATLASLVAEDGDNHHEHQLIRDALAELAQAADRVGFDQPVQPAVLLLSLRERLDERRTSLGFLSGGVTVCNLQPMRSLPFKVVCLLGMNDGVFPRVDRPLAFDKRSEQPQIGDRSSRIDDRYLFLEAVLAARQRLLVSFVGRSIADDSLLPPSVVVSELLDVMDPGTGGGGLVTQHPLQPFNPRYFSAAPEDRDLVSYSGVWCQAAQAAAGTRAPAPEFLAGPLPGPGPEREPIGLDDLIRFYRRPVAWLLEQRLGLRLDELQGPASQREPLELDGLDEYLLGQALLAAALEVDSPDWAQALAIQRAAGRLPPGAAGDVLMHTMAGRIEPLLQAARPLLDGPAQPPLALDLDLGPEHLSGTLTNLRPQGQVVVSYGRLDAKRRLVGWLRHLALVSAADSGQDRSSVLIGRAKEGDPIERVCLGQPARDPTTLLADLVAIFRYGQSAPLRFFPNSSLAYAQAMAGKDPDDPVLVGKALKKAYQQFQSGRYPGALPGEGEHPAVRKALGDLDPLGAPSAAEGFGFVQLAVRIWGPFLEAVAAGGAP